MNNKDRKLQDLYLNNLRKEKIPVSVFLVNGTRLKGIIKGFDNFVILLKQQNEQLIYKHAISTISPEKEFSLRVDEGQEEK
ncbi:MAG: RNA chaperone Hfq [Nitrospiraceae bacterium]|nr:MAG: RNA chaperone Hfq [Nitrospiraceae bacterium]